MLALFGKEDIPQFLVTPFLVKMLVSFVLGKSIQTNGDKSVFSGKVLGKIRHFLGQPLALKFRMYGKTVDVSTIAVRSQPFNGYVFLIH